MYDTVIVGAGSAGCVLAGRLSEDPDREVCLIEAGGPDRKLEIKIPAGFPELFKTPYDWDLATEPDPGIAGRSEYWPRGKTLGGSSSLNAQMYLRGHPSDFDGWAAAGASGWGWDDLLPAFRKAENDARGATAWRGVGGPLHVEQQREPNPLTQKFLQAARQVGLGQSDDPNGPRPEGAALAPVTQHRGRRWSTADAYLRPARRRRNLTIRTKVHAARVLVSGTRAQGVEVIGPTGLERIEAREVILAAGAIGSPQLLLRSGIGPADQLRALAIPVVLDLPGVGGNLQDHVAVVTIRATTRPISLWKADSNANLLRWLVSRRGPFTSNIGEGVVFTRLDDAAPGPDLELIFVPSPYLDHGLTEADEHMVTIAPVCLRPESRGRITLRSVDPTAPPRIEANYLSAAADLDVLRRGVMLAEQIFSAPAFAGELRHWVRPGAAPSEVDVEDFIRRTAQTLYHPVGTCRIGVDDDAVVDPLLRVRGIDGLRVVDASVMPTLNRGHTNAPTIAIAERAAELIKGRLVLPETPTAAPEPGEVAGT